MTAETRSQQASVDDRRDVIREGLEAATGVPFTKNNEIEVLRNGNEIFPAMLDAIRAARQRIEFLTFIYWTGDIAFEMASALAERAKEGIDVFVMLDSFGARPMNRELTDMMEDAGCRILWFNPIPQMRLWRTDNRTHRKLLIVDGELGFTGGVGIAAEWQGAGDNPENWRDNHFRTRGPAVRGLRAGFYGDWMESTDSSRGALDTLAKLQPEGNAEVQVLLSQAALGWSAMARQQDALIRLAKRRVRVQTPYFAPSGMQLNAVLEARSRGVEIEFMIPGPYIDKRVSELAGADEILQLLDAGVRLWRFQPTMLHSKLITVDGLAASVGTANFNLRSISKDNELAVTVLDSDFTSHLDAMWDEDCEHCQPDTREDWSERGTLRRVAEKLASPLKQET